MRHLAFFSLGALALVTAVACSDSHSSTTDAGARVDSGPVRVDAGPTGTDAGPSDPDAGVRVDAGPTDPCMDPPTTQDRPAPVECTRCRPPGPGPSGTGGECDDDPDCTAGENGRCLWGRIGRYCTYDDCFVDADCPAGQVCMCDTGPGSQNICVTAGCTRNGECGASSCSFTLGSCGHYLPPQGYYCHTPSDACQSDDDCAAPATCRFDPTVGTWSCQSSECVG